MLCLKAQRFRFACNRYLPSVHVLFQGILLYKSPKSFYYIIYSVLTYTTDVVYNKEKIQLYIISSLFVAHGYILITEKIKSVCKKGK